MDSCMGVEQDLDKATSKFNTLNEHTNKVLEDIISQVEDLKNEISKQPPDSPLTQAQTKILSDLAANVKQTVFQMSTEHRELHATVSRVGKSIDRHFIVDYASVAPKAESFSSETNKPIMEQAIAQHLYRQVRFINVHSICRMKEIINNVIKMLHKL
ncbi:PREDICTED: protein RMD5 homolog B [Papilio polytes]|uniref:protein RMD5 homolog B n=1 Tax=Papilio polytes TaxID=76194 RepID=UPI000676072E|nr:PREDICTED: protein RMD5 homolog B [Papilio polytes]